MTRRRFIADTWTATAATLTGDQAVHLARVLRAAPGQVYDVVAGGFLRRAVITSISPPTSSPQEVHFQLHEELESDTALPLHLLIAIFKFDHFEWGIEKATELGVARITPILARRTEKNLAQAAAKRVDRWRRIALEASKQSRRSSIPEIATPAPLPETLAIEQSSTRILLSEVEQSTPLLEALRASTDASPASSPASSPDANPAASPATSQAAATPSPTPLTSGAAQPRHGAVPVPPPPQTTHALAIGPEGGWTAQEMQISLDHGWQPVTLGSRILRAETAAIAAIAITSAHLD